MAQLPTASPITEKYLRLHLCHDVGPIRFANLLREFGDIDTVLGAGVQRLASAEAVGPKVAESIARGRDALDANAEIESARQHGVHICCLADEEYPAALRTIPDPPPCLYIRGSIEREDTVALAIVGTRRCSRYGAEQAERFGALAGGAGLTIVSGMARGIDTAAHRGALAAGGRTLAIMGCGLAHLYPPEATEIARRITDNGALLSELPMDTAPNAENFPPRNRIIAGLSLGVLVIEAGRRSGASISARLATEYNREVFAVPGRVDTPYARGCHDLIKRGAAKLVTDLADILEELGETGAALMQSMPGDEAAESSLPKTIANLDEAEHRVLEALGSEPRPIEDLCEATDLPPARVAVALTGLQLKGAIHRSGSDLYERRTRA